MSMRTGKGHHSPILALCARVRMVFREGLVAVVTAAVLTAWSPASAEVSEVRIAHAYGIIVLPLMIMEHDKLLEKQAKERGLSITVKQATLGTGDVLTAALLSGSVHIASVGVPVMIQLWDKSRGTLGIKGIASMANMPMYLNTRRPEIKTVKDFTDKNRIAVPGFKTSIQALVLQMAAAQAFGEENYAKLDPITVGLAHPEAMNALLSGISEIDTHFTSPPYQQTELQNPTVHTVLTSSQVLGGPASLTVLLTTTKFRTENPKTYQAFIAALGEAIDSIKRDKRRAARVYLEMSKEKTPLEFLVSMLESPEFEFSKTPERTMKYAQFMHKIGAIKNDPSSWKDMFFSDVHQLPGS